MTADYKVIIDANVLANIAVCDLLLRLAEKPRLYIPKWSENILDEVHKVHVERLHWPADLAKRFQHEVREAFPDAMVKDFDHLLSVVTNEPGDHHVLAAAIHSKARHIITFNLKDFPATALEPFSVIAQHPQDYLLTLYDLDPLQVVLRISAIATQRGSNMEDELLRLGVALPLFTSRLLDDLNL